MTSPTLAPVQSPGLAGHRTRLINAAEALTNLGHWSVVDSRPLGEFLAGHLPDARSLPLASLVFDDTTSDTLARLTAAFRVALESRGILVDAALLFVDDGDGSAALGALLAEGAGCPEAGVLRGGIRE